MREVPVTVRKEVDAAAIAPFLDALREQRTSGDVLAWARALSPPRGVTAIVTQDEYTHDVIIQLSESLFLVYDTT